MKRVRRAGGPRVAMVLLGDPVALASDAIAKALAHLSILREAGATGRVLAAAHEELCSARRRAEDAAGQPSRRVHLFVPPMAHSMGSKATSPTTRAATLDGRVLKILRGEGLGFTAMRTRLRATDHGLRDSLRRLMIAGLVEKRRTRTRMFGMMRPTIQYRLMAKRR